MARLTFNYPQGVFLLLGVAAVVAGDYVLPWLGIGSDTAIVDAMPIAGALFIVFGCLLFVVEPGR